MLLPECRLHLQHFVWSVWKQIYYLSPASTWGISIHFCLWILCHNIPEVASCAHVLVINKICFGNINMFTQLRSIYLCDSEYSLFKYCSCYSQPTLYNNHSLLTFGEYSSLLLNTCWMCCCYTVYPAEEDKCSPWYKFFNLTQ